MAAYCRVSTDQEEQLLSYENQVNYYTKFIKDNPLYTFAGVYADAVSYTHLDVYKRQRL